MSSDQTVGAASLAPTVRRAECARKQRLSGVLQVSVQRMPDASWQIACSGSCVFEGASTLHHFYAYGPSASLEFINVTVNCHKLISDLSIAAQAEAPPPAPSVQVVRAACSVATGWRSWAQCWWFGQANTSDELVAALQYPTLSGNNILIGLDTAVSAEGTQLGSGSAQWAINITDGRHADRSGWRTGSAICRSLHMVTLRVQHEDSDITHRRRLLAPVARCNAADCQWERCERHMLLSTVMLCRAWTYKPDSAVTLANFTLSLATAYPPIVAFNDPGYQALSSRDVFQGCATGLLKSACVRQDSGSSMDTLRKPKASTTAASPSTVSGHTCNLPTS